LGGRLPLGLAEFEAREAQKSNVLIYVMIRIAAADAKHLSARAICMLQDMASR
jgi:hypothetical protein